MQRWIREWYDPTVGLLLAPILLTGALLLLVLGSVINRVIGVVGFLVAIWIAAPRLAELKRRRRSGAWPR